MGLCFFSAIGAGAAMPLMFVVFGRLVGNFTDFFKPGTGVTYDQFMHQVIQNTYVILLLSPKRTTVWHSEGAVASVALMSSDSPP